MTKPWVYIASPYTKGDQALNVRFQMSVWDRLISLGVVPIAPLWSHFQHMHAPRPYQDWIDYDNEIITRCDACVRLDAFESNALGREDYYQSESSGADAEVELFRKLGKPVFFGVHELKHWLERPSPHTHSRQAVGTPRLGKLAGVTLIGLAGHIGSGKSAAASMIPGAHHLQWADPIYRGLSAMLDVPEEVLRDRAAKEQPIDVGGIEIVPRECARTLGSEWGRTCVHDDIWVLRTLYRIARLRSMTHRDVFAICGTRFPNEAAAIRDNGGEVWWVERPGCTPPAKPHKSDTALVAEDCDRVIVNRGTMDDLRRNVESAWQDFLGSSREPVSTR